MSPFMQLVLFFIVVAVLLKVAEENGWGGSQERERWMNKAFELQHKGEYQEWSAYNLAAKLARDAGSKVKFSRVTKKEEDYEFEAIKGATKVEEHVSEPYVEPAPELYDAMPMDYGVTHTLKATKEVAVKKEKKFMMNGMVVEPTKVETVKRENKVTKSKPSLVATKSTVDASAYNGEFD